MVNFRSYIFLLTSCIHYIIYLYIQYIAWVAFSIRVTTAPDNQYARFIKSTCILLGYAFHMQVRCVSDYYHLCIKLKYVVSLIRFFIFSACLIVDSILGFTFHKSTVSPISLSADPWKMAYQYKKTGDYMGYPS